jgi:hypothetical protein
VPGFLQLVYLPSSFHGSQNKAIPTPKDGLVSKKDETAQPPLASIPATDTYFGNPHNNTP